MDHTNFLGCSSRVSCSYLFVLYLLAACLTGINAAPFGYGYGGKRGFGGGNSVLMPPPIDPSDPAFNYVGGFMGPLYGGRGYYSGPGLNLAMQGLQGYGTAVYGWGPRGYMGYGPMTPYDLDHGLVRPSDRRGVPSLNTRVTQAFFAQLSREERIRANMTAMGYGPGSGAGFGSGQRGGAGFPALPGGEAGGAVAGTRGAGAGGGVVPAGSGRTRTAGAAPTVESDAGAD